MKDIGVKSKVLKEIMDLMDQKEGDKLKGHPKLVAMKVTTAMPMKGKMIDKEDMMDDEPKEVEELEDKMDSDISEDISPELLAQLLKLSKK
jgi:hypothetical protein